MSFADFMWSLKWDFLRSRLIAMWVPANQLEWTDFNDINQLNQLAEQIVPDLIKKNPNIANLIKQNSTMLWAEKQKEVVEVIDKL